MIPTHESIASESIDRHSVSVLIVEAADKADNLRKVSERTGISRRRLGYLLAQERDASAPEIHALKMLINNQI